MNRIICIYILLFLGVPCLAQQTKEHSAYTWLPLLEQLCDYDDIEEHDMEDMFEQLCELEQTPLDLNKATDEDLLRLFFLSPKQREDLTEQPQHAGIGLDYEDRLQPYIRPVLLEAQQESEREEIGGYGILPYPRSLLSPHTIY